MPLPVWLQSGKDKYGYLTPDSTTGSDEQNPPDTSIMDDNDPAPDENDKSPYDSDDDPTFDAADDPASDTYGDQASYADDNSIFDADSEDNAEDLREKSEVTH